MTSRDLRALAGAALLALAGCSGGSGGGAASSGPVDTPGASFVDPTNYSAAASASLASASEISVVTRGQALVGGASLAYTATTGHITAPHYTSGVPQASFFYVAYTVDGRDPATRPVTFFYNGGPGSATVWLHMGSFGPKRLATGMPSTANPAPFPLLDNAETMLDLTDLVFVDAVGAGYSQAIGPFQNRSFWGVDTDAAVFRDFVIRYSTANGRTAAPKFLFGESYGTTRSAVLANLLESAGMPLRGVILQSSVLDYNSNCGVVERAANSCAPILPSYGATGMWFNRVTPAPTSLPAYMDQMRTMAVTDYDPAVRAWLATPVAPDPALIGRLVNATGVAAATWQSFFNLSPGRFHTALIPGTTLGLYDARVSAPNGSSLASEGDPSSTFISAGFATGFRSYLTTTLGYTTPSAYTLLGSAIDSWNFSHDGRPLPDTIPDIAAALAHNPRLKVLAVSGYHDLVTPFFLTERDLSRLPVAAPVQVRNYAGGHMTYLDDQSRPLLKADLAAFYQAALAAKSTEGAASTPAMAKALPAPIAGKPAAPESIPPPVLEGPLRGVQVPESLRGAQSTQPPTRGSALEAQVEAKLKREFDRADSAGTGFITREQARAAGLGFIDRHFDAIDENAAGTIDFAQFLRYLRSRN